MTPTTQLILKPGKEASLARRHPWVFSGAIAAVQGANPKTGLEEGAIVDVCAHDGSFLARGHYQVGSIAVRILTFQQHQQIDLDFYQQRIAQACQLRQELGLLNDPHTNALRLVFGEGDYIPGLVADFYNGILVTQCHSVGIFRDRELIFQAFRNVLGASLRAIYDKSEATVPYKAELGAANGYVYQSEGFDPEDENIAQERGLSFLPDYVLGQKTGFFVDQRDNRALVERYARGRNVLNLFCYTGGFSLAALRGGANLVHSVDSSERAIQLAKRNVDLNFPGDQRHQAFTDDAFHFMAQPPANYDLVVLDPPAFAKHIGVLQNALKGYRRLNTRALQLVQTGGLLFTFSCSQVVSRSDFRTMVFSAAAAANRNAQVLAELTQAPDHPIDIFHPEGHYLKGLLLRVI